MDTRKKSGLRLVAGTLVSLGFLWLAFRGVDWHSARETIARANIWLLLVALGTVVLTALQKSARWRTMFYPDHRRLRLGRFFSIFLVGQVINAVVPARLGEVARAYLVGESEGVSKAHALWTAIVEKVLDAFTLLLLLAGMSLFISLPLWLQQARWTLGLAIGAGLMLLALAVVFRKRAIGWLERWNTSHPWWQRFRLPYLLQVIIDSLRLMRRPQLLGGLLGWSVVAFLTAAATNWITARALGLRLSYSACLLLLAVLQISAVVPIPTTPGRVGLFHYLCVVSLAIFGVDRDVALSYSLVLHVLVYLPMMVGGPIGIWLAGTHGYGAGTHWHDMLRQSGGQRNEPANDDDLAPRCRHTQR